MLIINKNECYNAVWDFIICIYRILKAKAHLTKMKQNLSSNNKQKGSRQIGYHRTLNAPFQSIGVIEAYFCTQQQYQLAHGQGLKPKNLFRKVSSAFLVGKNKLITSASSLYCQVLDLQAMEVFYYPHGISKVLIKQTQNPTKSPVVKVSKFMFNISLQFKKNQNQKFKNNFAVLLLQQNQLNLNNFVDVYVKKIENNLQLCCLDERTMKKGQTHCQGDTSQVKIQRKNDGVLVLKQIENRSCQIGSPIFISIQQQSGYMSTKAIGLITQCTQHNIEAIQFAYLFQSQQITKNDLQLYSAQFLILMTLTQTFGKTKKQIQILQSSQYQCREELAKSIKNIEIQLTKQINQKNQKIELLQEKIKFIQSKQILYRDYKIKQLQNLLKEQIQQVQHMYKYIQNQKCNIVKKECLLQRVRKQKQKIENKYSQLEKRINNKEADQNHKSSRMKQKCSQMDNIIKRHNLTKNEYFSVTQSNTLKISTKQSFFNSINQDKSLLSRINLYENDSKTIQLVQKRSKQEEMAKHEQAFEKQNLSGKQVSVSKKQNINRKQVSLNKKQCLNGKQVSLSTVPQDQDAYLKQAFKTSEQIRKRYFKHNQEQVMKARKYSNFDFTTEGYRLYHGNLPINMDQFTKVSWHNVESLNLVNCQVDDQKWRSFVNKANLFQNLKWLWIHQNGIVTVNQKDLTAFKSLQGIQFSSSRNNSLLNSDANPLSNQSKQFLASYKLINPDVQIWF